MLKLFLVFARVGVMTFGGGYAMLPLLMREIVTKREWLTDTEFADFTAVGQTTPGIIAVNIATSAGYRRARVSGGICATLGMIFPSVVIITAAAALLGEYRQIPAVAHAFAGIRLCVCALIVKTVVSLWKTAVPDVTRAVVFIAVFALSFLFGVTPALLAVGAAAFGVVHGRVLRARKKNK